MSASRRHALMAFIALVAAFSMLEGCASMAYLPGQQTIGRLRIIGLNVKVNGAPALDGQTVTSGDFVTTGADSSAYIHFLSGGFIHLDENTDPGFKLVWDKTQCIFEMFKFNQGQASQQTTSDDCQSFLETPVGKFFREDTQFNVLVNQQKTIMTVLEGRMMLVSPQQMVLEEGQQMIVTKSGVEGIRRLSKKELLEVTKWRDRFPPPSGSGVGEVGQCVD